MFERKTQEELDTVVSLGKSESVIRKFFTMKTLTDKVVSLEDAKKEEYLITYPNVDESDTPILYIRYDETEEVVTVDEVTGESITTTEPVISDEYYDITNEDVLDDDGNVVDINVIKTLKEEYVNATVIPSENKYIEDAVEAYLKDPVNTELDGVSYTVFMKPILLELVSNTFETAIRTITDAYPEHEQKTWDKQEFEARAWLVNNTAPTPILDGIVSIRGIDKDILVSKVIEKADEFALLSGMSIGYRQKAEDMTTAIVSIADLDEALQALSNDRDTFNSMF